MSFRATERVSFENSLKITNSIPFLRCLSTHSTHSIRPSSLLSSLKFSIKNEKQILKIFLLNQLHQLFHDFFYQKIHETNGSSMECYAVDNKIIQLLIHGIVETEEYTLEGIAYHTGIPFDVIYEAACGSANHFSITTWVKIVELYAQVKPEVTRLVFDRLIEIKDKSGAGVSLMINEL